MFHRGSLWEFWMYFLELSDIEDRCQIMTEMIKQLPGVTPRKWKDQESIAMWPLGCWLRDDQGVRVGQESSRTLSHRALLGAKRPQTKKARYVSWMRKTWVSSLSLSEPPKERSVVNLLVPRDTKIPSNGHDLGKNYPQDERAKDGQFQVRTPQIPHFNISLFLPF